jgi:CheY-like chemotaxis protein
MSHPRILVVDDSLTIRRAFEFILKPHGYALEFAADGHEALSRASSFAPDLVLLDYVLPDMRGPDVCAGLALAPTTATTPVILVSAKGASIRQAYQDAQNVVSYITKPFKAEVVCSVVANALVRARTGSTASPPSASASRARKSEAVTPPRASPPAAVGPDRSSGPSPVTVAETFSALLAQLEDAIATNAADRPTHASDRDDRSAAPQRLAPGLAQASHRMSEIAQHLVDGTIAPYRLRNDGSFASIAATLLEAHRSLCEAAIALAATGGPEARLPEGPHVVAAGPAGHPLLDEISRAFDLAPEVRAIVLESDFDALPALVKLLAPEHVAVVAGVDAPLDQAWRRARAVRPQVTRFVALAEGVEGDAAEAFDSRLVDAEAVRRWVGELAVGRGGGPATAVEIALEIVAV